ncbi:TDT family transporter [Olsenella sp. DNF00959]|uniref:TDT family transporter n=1 Tax=Olsenella sp. DNF00959 TaxID=1476999 RepID=UPI000782D1E4|nr:TDT family transporter [Olsenella sp. DNF00959]
MLRRVPLPLSGVMLGLVGLGNLLQSYGEPIRMVCGILATVMGIVLVAKVALYPEDFRRDMANPMLASIAGTFPMALLLLAGYAKPVLEPLGYLLWYLGLALHLALIVWFTARYVLHFQLKQVFPSWYIVYVGIVAASITAPAMGRADVGTVAFWFGVVTFVLVSVAVALRYLRVGEPPVPARPVLCICTAPASLCVVGYVQSVTPKSVGFLVLMEVVASVIFLGVLTQLPRLLAARKFAPSFATYTFPLVITATALKQTMACLAKIGSPAPWLQLPVLVETVIATLLLVYALVRYVMFVLSADEAGDGEGQKEAPAKT